MRGRQVYIVQPTCPDVNKHLMELLLLISTARRSSADKITAVIPYVSVAGHIPNLTLFPAEGA